MKACLRWLILGILGFIIGFYLAGCAEPSIHSRSDTYEYPEYRLIVVQGSRAVEIVDEYCRKTEPGDGGHWDDGSPIRPGQVIRACTTFKSWNRDKRPTIVIPEEIMGCLPHEMCHGLRLGDEQYCMREFPCVGEKAM